MSLINWILETVETMVGTDENNPEFVRYQSFVADYGQRVDSYCDKLHALKNDINSLCNELGIDESAAQ